MEPRLFSHGYHVCVIDDRCFDRLQWSHGFSAMDTRAVRRSTAPPPRSFNGATAFQPWIHCTRPLIWWNTTRLQWSHGFSAMDTLANGDVVEVNDYASMEPRLFSHGYRATPSQSSRRSAGFNGATAFQPWIRGKTSPIQKRILRLQWSHGFSAMDTQQCPRYKGTLSRASMEPRLFSHGYDESEWKDPANWRLQWSHGFSAMDTVMNYTQVSAQFPRFNGATAFQPWIRARCARRSRVPGESFNGATAFQPWIQREIRVTVTIPYRSRLRFQGSTFLSSYDCQCLPRNSTMFTTKCARAIPSMRVAPDLSHYERNRARPYTLCHSSLRRLKPPFA